MGCGIWPEIDLDMLSREHLARLAGRRYPLSGSFELTERCNLGCVHCCINQPATSATARARELTTAQVCGVLDQIADAGCLHLLLTGGEPLLRPDFPAIWQYAVRKGFLLTFFTNGTLLNSRMADLLAEWLPYALEITLYGATQETYEQVTGVPGSYAACLRGIELALERRLPLSLKTMVLRANRHELDEMKALAGRLGVKFRYDSLLWPRRDGGKGPYAQQLTAEEILALDRDDPERMREWQELDSNAAGWVRGDAVYACGAGRYNFHVDCTGQLRLCMSTSNLTYDLLHGSFQHGWENVLGPAIQEVRKQDTACLTCSAGALCQQCPGWSQTVHGDSETPVAFVCELGRWRARQFRSVHM